MNVNGANGDGDPETWFNGTASLGPGEGTSPIMLRGDVSKGDCLITAVHESYHFALGVPDGDRRLGNAEWRAFNQLSPADRAGARQHSDKFFHQWGSKYGSHPVGGSEPTVKWP
jgi:hypothetical protein